MKTTTAAIDQVALLVSDVVGALELDGCGAWLLLRGIGIDYAVS